MPSGLAVDIVAKAEHMAAAAAACERGGMNITVKVDDVTLDTAGPRRRTAKTTPPRSGSGIW